MCCIGSTNVTQLRYMVGVIVFLYLYLFVFFIILYLLLSMFFLRLLWIVTRSLQVPFHLNLIKCFWCQQSRFLIFVTTKPLRPPRLLLVLQCRVLMIDYNFLFVITLNGISQYFFIFFPYGTIIFVSGTRCTNNLILLATLMSIKLWVLLVSTSTVTLLFLCALSI